MLAVVRKEGEIREEEGGWDGSEVQQWWNPCCPIHDDLVLLLAVDPECGIRD